MNSLFSELHDVARFFEAILICGIYTGLAVSIPLAFLYEFNSKRRITR